MISFLNSDFIPSSVYDGAAHSQERNKFYEAKKQEKRDRLTDDHVRDLHMITAVLYCAQSDLGGKAPKQGSSLEIATREGGAFFQKYYVVASTSHMGMLYVELEAMAQ